MKGAEREGKNLPHSKMCHIYDLPSRMTCGDLLVTVTERSTGPEKELEKAFVQTPLFIGVKTSPFHVSDPDVAIISSADQNSPAGFLFP